MTINFTQLKSVLVKRDKEVGPAPTTGALHGPGSLLGLMGLGGVKRALKKRKTTRKENPNHDAGGRFSAGGSGVTVAITDRQKRPKSPKAKRAIPSRYAGQYPNSDQNRGALPAKKKLTPPRNR